MTKVLVLDDGCHETQVIVNCNDALIKMSLAYFINIHLSVPHSEDYYIKTLHYENIKTEINNSAFNILNKIKTGFRVSHKKIISAFNTLFSSNETIDGCIFTNV